MLQKLKRLGSYLIIIVLLPYVITVFMNGQAVPASKTVDTMQVKACLLYTSSLREPSRRSICISAGVI